MTDTKTCSRCKVEKPLTEFYKNCDGKGGLKSQCKTCVRAANKLWRENNREKDRAAKKLWRENNREKDRAMNKVWWENNREKSRAWGRERYANIPHKLLHLIRLAVIRATGKSTRKKEALELLGCTLEEYVQYLESKFTEGMTWENHTTDGWHIDHIKPLREKELTLEEGQKRLHYTNTQPLWAKDNLAKGNNA